MFPERYQAISDQYSGLKRGRSWPHLRHLHGSFRASTGFGQCQAEYSLGLLEVFRLFTQKDGGQFHGGAKHVHGLNLGWCLAIDRIFGYERLFGLVVKPGPGHSITTGVELHFEPGEHGEAKDAINGGPWEPQSIHSLELERVFHPAFEVSEPDSAFQVEAIDRGPELTCLGFQTNFPGGGCAHIKRGGSRIDQEIERALAIDPHTHQIVVGERPAIRDRERLADLGVFG